MHWLARQLSLAQRDVARQPAHLRYTARPVREPNSPSVILEGMAQGRRAPRNESTLVSWCMDHIKRRGDGHARKVHGSAFQSAGEPDIDACVAGRAVKVEVKMPGGTPTPIQMGAMRRWESAGALTGWVTSVDELKKLLDYAEDHAWVNPQLCRHKGSPGADGHGVCTRCGAEGVAL